MNGLPRKSWINIIVPRPAAIPSTVEVVDSFAGVKVTTRVDHSGTVYSNGYDWAPAEFLGHR